MENFALRTHTHSTYRSTLVCSVYLSMDPKQTLFVENENEEEKMIHSILHTICICKNPISMVIVTCPLSRDQANKKQAVLRR